MNGKDALKACDFCRSSDVTAYRPALTQTWAVYCLGCEARGPVALSREEATRLWNTRSSGWEDERAELVGALESALKSIEGGRLYERMCCDGRDCGCYGATFADEVLHYGRGALAKSLPSIGEP